MNSFYLSNGRRAEEMCPVSHLQCSRAWASHTDGLCDPVSPRAVFAGSWGEGESGCLLQTGESLAWPNGGGFGGCPLACPGVSSQPGLTAGEVVSRVQCSLC